MYRYLSFLALFSFSILTYAQDKVIDSIQRDAAQENNTERDIPKEELVSSNPIDSIQEVVVIKKDSSSQKKNSTKKSITKERKRLLKEKLRKKVFEQPKFTYEKYQIISYERDTTYLDTSLTIDKTYKFNYFRKDMFGKVSLDNAAQAYTRLERSFDDINLYPNMGLEAKHYNYEKKKEMKFYSMASPTTELYYKNGVNKGQFSGLWISVNTSKKFNISFGYDGTRSLGNYKNFLANISKLNLSMNYHTRNERFQSRFHFINQDFENKENGGIIDENEFEENRNKKFRNKERINVNYSKSSSELFGRRYYFDNELFVSRRYENTGTNLSIGHQFMYHIKYFSFTQETPSEIYGLTFNTKSRIRDIVDYRALENVIFSRISNKKLGDIRLEATHQDFKYFFQRVYYKEDGLIPNIIQRADWTMSGSWKRSLINNIKAEVSGGKTLKSEPPERFYFSANIRYQPKDDVLGEISYLKTSRYPNLNTLLHQSSYKSYNWVNLSKFKMEGIDRVSIRLKYKKLFNLKLEHNTIVNHTYFIHEGVDTDNTTNTNVNTDNTTDIDGDATKKIQKINTMPLQYKDPIRYLKLRFTNEFRVWKLALRNDFIYQKTEQSESILNLPEIVTRNTLYLFSDVFKKAMYLEFGVTLKYFTEYYADEYNPLIGEYNIQTRKLIGGYPVFDVFASGRIKQTRVFMILEHFNSPFSSPYYSAPRYPYRDISFRFGLVWDFFM